jgi:hypothetical protein
MVAGRDRFIASRENAGQEVVIHYLFAQLVQNKMPHAYVYLFKF